VLKGENKKMNKESGLVEVEQKLLDAINSSLTVAPAREDMDKAYVAVLTYKEFQHALMVKLERDGY
jgi:hypothetical protein